MHGADLTGVPYMLFAHSEELTATFIGQTEACLDMSGVDGWQALVYSLKVAPIDSMSCAYDAALLCLSENFPEIHARDDS